MDPLTLPVGAKVVCIEDRFRLDALLYHNILPLAGRIYTVTRSYYGYCLRTGERRPGFQLGEVPAIYPKLDCGFLASRFRPLEDLEEHESGQTALSSRMTLGLLATTMS